MKKALFVVRVDNYFPEMCEFTIPSIRKYAQRIGADYIEITDRKFPEFPPTYEKMQVYELGKNYDICILSDADNIIHPKAPDISMFIQDKVGCFSAFDTRTIFETDKYFLRDGRYIGIASGFVMSSSLTHDVWTPLEFGWEEARTKTQREFIIDEYCLSRNLAKFGLKFTGLNYDDSAKQMFFHLGVEEKLDRLEIVNQAETLYKRWNIGG